MPIKLNEVRKYRCRHCGAEAEEPFPEAFEVYPDGCTRCTNSFKRYKAKLEDQKLKEMERLDSKKLFL